MRVFEIIDEENSMSVGTLIYYEKAQEFVVELSEDVDEWTAPLMMTSFVKRGIYTIPREISYLWVRERVIPSGRQNIGSILANHKLRAYDEMKFLEISEGRCCQDSMYIRKVDALPDYVVRRQLHNLQECVVSPNKTLLCFFGDRTMRRVAFDRIRHVEGVDKLIANEILLRNVEVGVGGYYVSFGDSIDISARVLYEEGEYIPLTIDDFTCFVSNNVVDTTESCDLLECSRQNISYMVRKNQIEPIREYVKGTLFLKGDVQRSRW